MTVPALLLLVSVSPGELEASGQLVMAGAAWEAAGDVRGQAGVMAALLEDALYSADLRRAWLLAGELEALGASDDLLAFWSGRMAWASGLRSEACRTLSEVGAGDPWLLHRARGLALLYGGDPEGAVQELALSVVSADGARKALYASLDLCCALLSSGETDRALETAGLLCRRFPAEPLPVIMESLCLQLSGSGIAALRRLSELPPGSPAGALLMAARLEREFVD